MRRPLTDEAGEVRELTSADFRGMASASQVLPPETAKILPAHASKQASSRKTEKVTIDLDRDVVDRFRAGGPGWESRINDALKKAPV